MSKRRLASILHPIYGCVIALSCSANGVCRLCEDRPSAQISGLYSVIRTRHNGSGMRFVLFSSLVKKLSGSGVLLVVRCFIRRLWNAGAQGSILITSRLDNDDAIARDFVEMVQNCFTKQEVEFINFTYGAQYSDGRMFARLDPSNAFISLIERRLPPYR